MEVAFHSTLERDGATSLTEVYDKILPLGSSAIWIVPKAFSYFEMLSCRAARILFMWPGLTMTLAVTAPAGGATIRKSRTNSSFVWLTPQSKSENLYCAEFTKVIRGLRITRCCTLCHDGFCDQIRRTCSLLTINPVHCKSACLPGICMVCGTELVS